MEKEIWKDIIGYEGLYQVSNLGQVRSLDRIVKCGLGHERPSYGKILLPRDDTHGYLYINLSNKGVVKGRKIHRLVAEAFLTNPEDKRTVNHKNGIRYDNRLENLERMTSSENNKDGYNRGTIGAAKGKFGVNNPHSKTILQCTLDGTVIKERYGGCEIQRILGYKQPNINKCCLGKRNTAYNFIWKYK